MAAHMARSPMENSVRVELPASRAAPIPDICTAVAHYLVTALLGVFFLPCLLFILELFAMTSLLKWELPVAAAAIAPIAALWLIREQSLTTKATAFLLFVAAMASALFVASLFYDVTWDGRAYHADGILLILAGSNPIYEMMHGFDDLWTNNYPKITWYFAAIATHLTGNYNLGKCGNLMLIYATAAYVFSFLKDREFSTGNALLAAVAVSLNPVSISQLHCFYVDGQLAALSTLAVFSSLAMLRTPRLTDKLVFFISACLLINIKFTGAAYLAIIVAVTVTILWWRWYKSRSAEDFQHGRMVAGYIIVIGMIGGVVMGYNPYITNILVHGNIFFPLMGKGSIDVIAAQSPPTFQEQSMTTAQKLLLSTLSRAENIHPAGGTADPQLKLPFSTDEKEMSLYFANDLRIGAWGVLFSGILILASLLYFLSHGWTHSDSVVAIIIILVTALINPGSWWARYAPQVALLPLFMALYPLNSLEKWQRITAKFVMVLLIINSTLILPPSILYFQKTTRQIQYQINAITATCGKGTYAISDTDGYHLDQFLMNNGINVIYPKQDIRKTHTLRELFPLQNAFLYKEGCVRP